MKTVAMIVAISISLFGYIPYIRDSIKGKTKPHVISWFTWALISFLAFGVQIFNDGGIGSYINLFMGIICSTIFIIGLKNGTKNINKVDIIAFILALIAIAFWLVVKQPLISIILVVFIDIMSFFPTVRKSWNNPNDETLITWLLSCIKNGLSIYSLQTISFITVLYPLYCLIANLSFCIMLITRRRVIKG